MSLIVRLKRKMFAWNDNKANTYEYCLRNPDKDENAQRIKGMEEKYPEETARLKEKLKDPNFTTNNTKANNSQRNSYYENYKATTPEGIKVDKDLKSGLDSLNKQARKENKQLLKAIQRKKKIANIAGIGGGIAAAAGLGYGLKKAHDNKKAWEEEKKNIKVTDPSGKKLTQEEQDYFRGKETNSQKNSRKGTSSRILGATGAAGSMLGVVRGKKIIDGANDTILRHMDRISKEQNLVNSVKGKINADVAAVQNKYMQKIANKSISKRAAAERLQKRVLKKVNKSMIGGVSAGLLGGAALAAMYNTNKKIKNERLNSKRRLAALQKSEA